MGTSLNPKRQRFQDRALEETVGRTDVLFAQCRTQGVAQMTDHLMSRHCSPPSSGQITHTASAPAAKWSTDSIVLPLPAWPSPSTGVAVVLDGADKRCLVQPDGFETVPLPTERGPDKPWSGFRPFVRQPVSQA